MDLIKQEEEYYWSVLIKLKECYEENQVVPREITEYLHSMRYTKVEAWEILRDKWINSGFKWKWTDKNEKPNNWNKEMAIKQLENIGIFLEQ